MIGAAVTAAALIGWSSFRFLGSYTPAGFSHHFTIVYTLLFLSLTWQVALYTLEKTYKITAEEKVTLDQQKVTVLIPCYNEDPAYLRACLASIFRQTRKPNSITITDDGSAVNYDDIREWFEFRCARLGIIGYWKRQANQGKRHAQAAGVLMTKDRTDIYVTVDSDGILSPNAIEELLKPFKDEKVQSVAGVVLAENNRHNFLARFTDLLYVTQQLVDRSALSAMGSVMVNSGVLAAYRADVLTENMSGYLNETFFGRPVMFSDDSLLTLYALLKGKTVQQPSAIVFTAMPVKVSHHLRQYLRWMRGSTIRSFWRFKYLPLTGYAYWIHMIKWIQMLAATVIVGSLYFVLPASTHQFNWWIVIVPLAISYGTSLRYLTIRRSDQSLWSQLVNYSLAPVAMFWSFFVLRFVRWYAMATCTNTGWGTRQKGVEVSKSD